jgi:hypothetical protein
MDLKNNFVCCENPNGEIVLAINTVSIQTSNEHIVDVGNRQIIADNNRVNPQVIADNNRVNPQVIADNNRAADNIIYIRNRHMEAQIALMMRIERIVGILIIKIIILCVIISMIFVFLR